jgi:medium-chain acyl-[acyl-carrier-protein] hydrolase
VIDPSRIISPPSDHSVEWFRQVPLRSLRQIWCFPHAGAGAAEFSGWAKNAPAGTLVCAIRLPGRERRIAEPPFTDMCSLSRKFAETIKPLIGTEAVFYGQCTGAYVAFEVVAELEKSGGIAPRRLYVASRSPASAVSAAARPRTDYSEFRQRVKESGWLPAELYEDVEAWEVLEPPLRADFYMLDNYLLPSPPIRTPITALIGSEDEFLSGGDVADWETFTNAMFDIRIAEGDHLLSRSARGEILAILAHQESS